MDLNEDGNIDILSGSYSRMSNPMAGLFQVLWGQADGSFKTAATLIGTDEEPLIIPADEANIVENICTRPSAVDWDGDGNLDLVVGNFAGSFYLFTGEGKGRFNPQPTQIMSGDVPLKIQGVHSDPFVVDWDGDGDLDVLSGSSMGGVQWAENQAGEGNVPELKPFATLIAVEHQIEYGGFLSQEELRGPTTGTRIWVDDVNGDGKLDILVGDNTTLVSAADGLSEEEFNDKQNKWQDEYNRVMAEWNGLPPDADAEVRNKTSLKLSTVYQQRSEFIVEDRTGFVWLYIQK